jgi:hypothetical protein
MLAASPFSPNPAWEEDQILLKITGEESILVSRTGDPASPFDLALRGGE